MPVAMLRGGDYWLNVSAAIPAVLEAYAVTGSADVVCKVAATSHADLQQVLLRIDSSPSVARSTASHPMNSSWQPTDRS